MTENKCRRCLLREAYPEDYEKYVAGLLKEIPPTRRAPEALYRQRLDLCGACGRLNTGTCMGCGCLVELKAAYRQEKCPFHLW